MAGVMRSLFEDGYLLRELKSVAEKPEVAIAELVANAWDAGAATVSIEIPEEIGGIISVSDDGVGMTAEQFRARWMRHGYNRVRHQGEKAEFPPSRADWSRRAYGRNGIGRHGLLCFADRYYVDTKRFDSKTAHSFTVQPSSGASAFNLISDTVIEREDHGTKLWTCVEWHLPTAQQITDSLSFKFLFDPRFQIVLNGTQVQIEDFDVVHRKTIKIQFGASAEVLCIRASASKQWKTGHGVAFWVGGRLVGEPSYSLRGLTLIDGRTAIANKFMFIVKTDDFFNDVEPDWSDFTRNDRTKRLAEKVGKYINYVMGKLNAGRIQQNKKAALRENKEELRKLKPLARIEVSEFLDDLASEHPTLNSEMLTAAVKAAVNLEKSRSGRALLEKLAAISEEDAESINQILDNWTLRDALAVLDEIDRRVCVVQAIQTLMGDPEADELHTIHPLVTQARWLFGPEFDSPQFSSNVTIKTAAETVFQKEIDTTQIYNPRQRPDLIFLKDATLSLTGTEEFDEAGTITKLRSLLLIELKRGAFTIRHKEIAQAVQYVNDLLNCGLLDGAPFIRAFVVGHILDGSARSQSVGDSPTVGKIDAVSFSQLVRTANQRLFKLQERIAGRYRDVPGVELVDKVLGEPDQKELFASRKSGKPKVKRSKTTKA